MARIWGGPPVPDALLCCVIAYVRGRQKLWAAVGLVVGLILIGWDLAIAAGTYISQYAVRNDFRLAYGAALVGIRDGYGHLYDLMAQRAAIESLGPGFNPQPFISPPPLAWLATPFVLVPFSAALIIWTALLIAALVWTWYVLAPSNGLAKAAHLALLLGVFPVAFGVMVGQPGALVAAAVAAGWWLLRRGHAVWAGVALSLIVLKPQMAFLVPICLVVSGHARTFGAWLAVSLVIGLVALALLGHDGVTRYLDVLKQTQTPAWDITRRYSISGPIGLGPLLNVAQAVVVVIALVAAWRHRHNGPEIPIAAGIIGSLLATPYLGFQDFVMLIVAGLLLGRARANAWEGALMGVGFAPPPVVIVVLPVPLPLWGALLL